MQMRERRISRHYWQINNLRSIGVQSYDSLFDDERKTSKTMRRNRATSCKMRLMARYGSNTLGRCRVLLFAKQRLAIGALSVLLFFASCQLTRGDDFEFFEKKIRPVLVERCYKCHSAEAEKLKGEFLLDTKEG